MFVGIGCNIRHFRVLKLRSIPRGPAKDSLLVSCHGMCVLSERQWREGGLLPDS